jgi:transposase-like protein
MEKVMSALGVCEISSSSVSRITKELNEKVENKNLFMMMLLKKK